MPMHCGCITWLDVLIPSACLSGDCTLLVSSVLFTQAVIWVALRLHFKGWRKISAPGSHFTYHIHLHSLLCPLSTHSVSIPGHDSTAGYLSPDCSSCSWMFLFGDLIQSSFFSFQIFLSWEQNALYPDFFHIKTCRPSSFWSDILPGSPRMLSLKK